MDDTGRGRPETGSVLPVTTMAAPLRAAAFPDDLVFTPASFGLEGPDTTSVRLEWALE